MAREEPADKSRATIVAKPADSGARLDKWLAARLEGFTRTRVKALIEAGAVARNGKIVDDPAEKLNAGDRFAIALPPVESPAAKGEAIALDIHYEDDDIIVVDKPAGMVVHPAAGNWSGTMVNALIAHCGTSLSGVGGVARPGIVHRIDKDTSGLVVAAKNDAAHQALAKAFATHDIERVYDAIVVGAPRPGVGVIEAALARADRRKIAVVDEEREDARQAVTRYRVIEAFGRKRARLAGDALASLVECRLKTGRTHQIRVHLAYIGHPLIGDPVYGRGPGLGGLKPGEEASDKAIETLRAFRRQALHARVLGFAHPSTGAAMRFEAAPPADFGALAEALRAL